MSQAKDSDASKSRDLEDPAKREQALRERQKKLAAVEQALAALKADDIGEAGPPRQESTAGAIAGRGVKIIGEAAVAPGSSLLLEGRIREGGAHLLGGLAASYFIGPLGWIVASAMSYTRSVHDRGLISQVK